MLFRDIIEIASEYKIYSKAKNKNCQNNSTLYKDRYASQLSVFFHGGECVQSEVDMY